MTGPDQGHVGLRLRQELLSVLRTSLRGATKVAIVDDPYSANAGDAAIWLAERGLLRELNIEVQYVADAARYNKEALEKAVPTGPILLHGGGNFGDFWPEHHILRERVLRDFPTRRIIQLPQSIAYRSGKPVHDLPQHPDFQVLVREPRSLELAREASLTALLVPDVVLALPPWRQKVPRRYGVVCLLRTDHEATGIRETFARSSIVQTGDAVITDWGMPPLTRAVWVSAKTPARISRRLTPTLTASRQAQRFTMAGYDALAEICVASAQRQLARAEIVVTDRLHAHILALRAGQVSIALDNSYGKLSGVYQAYSRHFPQSYLASTPDEALALAERLRRRS